MLRGTYRVNKPSSPILLPVLIYNEEITQSGNEIGSESTEDDGKTTTLRRRNEGPGKDDEALSNNEGEEAYIKFKNRKAVKRRNVAASTRKDKAVGKGTIVGKKPRKSTDRDKSFVRKTRDYGDDSDDNLMEHTLPDYLQDRRARFDKRMENLKEAGLKLPPSYEHVDFSDDDRLEHLHEKPIFPNAKASAQYKDIQLPYSLGLIPAPIAQWLRDYQVQGASFLHKLFVYQTGGILGDEMGLGKTIQVIAFLTAAFGKTGDERDAKRMRKMRRQENSWYPRVLLVCPGTLIENWKAELQRWGWWHVDVFIGETKEAAIQAATTGRLEIMITTYATYRLNKSVINMIEWDCVVADECHLIKTHSSETSQAMRDINSLCRIGLTGTALANNYTELWALLNWTCPGQLGPISTWKSSISEPLKIGQSFNASVSQLALARKTAKLLVENLLPRFFLRRSRKVLLISKQLPKKSDRVVFCNLTNTQAEAYENYLDSEAITLIKTSSDPCTCGSGKKSGWCHNQYLSNGSRWQSYVFPAIMNLQKLCNHLAILIPQGTDPMEKQDKDLETLQIALPSQWRQLYHNRDSILNYSNPEFCGKWKVLKRMLGLWESKGDKVLVFSYSTRLLKMLQMLFNHTSYNVSYLDGGMSYEDRAKAVDDFNSDPSQFVFLISTKAGGIGINLSSANKVVIFDPNWNPAYDLQAQDRAYRIGQIRDVEVFRLVSAGTIEEIVYARQIYKQQQANIAYSASTERRYFKGVQENKDQKGEIFGLTNLFAYQNDSIVLRDIVTALDVAESKAGIQVIGLSLPSEHVSSDDEDNDPLLARDDENSAMSQLAALVTSETDPASNKNKSKPKRRPTLVQKADPIQGILAAAGVEYTHENSEVIGSSKVEARLSRNAEEEADYNLDAAKKHVFPESQSQQHFAQSGSDEESEKRKEFRYHPPQDVMKRQFCTMARTFGFEDATAFALVVEGWTQAQRRNCLEKFYRGRRDELRKDGVR